MSDYKDDDDKLGGRFWLGVAGLASAPSASR